MANVTTLLKYGLKTNIVKAILFDVLTNASRYYYVFGRSYPWPTILDATSGEIISSETIPPSVIDSYNYELEVRRNSVFLKLIDANDVAIVVNRRQWRIGFVYDMYDEYSSSNPSYSGATSLDQANFYVINSDFDVFKCLFNNYDKPSTVQPFLTGNANNLLKLEDGYIWKYMYSIPLSLRNKFLNAEYMPVLTSLTSSFYSNGAISGFSIAESGKNLVRFRRIKAFNIETGGSGYSSITVTFPQPSFTDLGTQAAVTINLVSGAADSVTLVKGSFYLFDPKPTITSTEGSGFGYTIEYEDDPYSGYSEIVISGDGQSQFNAYNIKSVTINDRGMFTSTTGGSLFNFPDPVDLGTGRKPNLQVNYRPKSGTWSYSTTTSTIITVNKISHGLSNGDTANLVFTSGVTRPSNGGYVITYVDANTFTVPVPNGYSPTSNQSGDVYINNATWSYSTSSSNIITITKTSHGLSDGSDVTLVFTSGANRPIDGLYAIDLIDTDTFTVEVPNDYLPGSNQSGNVSVDSTIRFELDTIEVVDGGYGYDKPLYSISNSPNTDDVYTVGGPLFTVSGSVLVAVDLDFNVSTQKNQAILVPVIGNSRELEHIIIQDPGLGYTQISSTFRSFIRTTTDPGVPDSIAYTLVQGSESGASGYIDDYSSPVIVANISQGNLDSKQSDVEILAVDGSIEVIKVINSGNGYSSTDIIEITGDGTGCTAIPVIEDSKIVAINVTNPGQGYTKAEVTIVDDIRSSINKATFRAIISPKGGHGKDAVNELFGRTISFYTKLVGNEKNQGLLVDNDYRQISIIKNPLKYDINEYYRNATGSGCVLAVIDNTTTNVTTYNELVDNAILKIGQDEFVLVHKEGPDANKYKLLLKPIDNYIPSAGESFIYIKNGTQYSISASQIVTPNFNKFSGEMLYIDNRVAFNPSVEQAVTITTLISF